MSGAIYLLPPHALVACTGIISSFTFTLRCKLWLFNFNCSSFLLLILPQFELIASTLFCNIIPVDTDVSENTPLTAHVLGKWQLTLTPVPHGPLPNTPYDTQRNLLHNSMKTRTVDTVMMAKQLSASCSKNCDILLVGVVYHKRAVMAGSKTRRGITTHNRQR